MRTTLTLDEDVAARIEEQRQREGLSLKQVINGLLREGLLSRERPAKPRKYSTRARALGLRPGFDPVKLNQLVDELDIDERIGR